MDPKQLTQYIITPTLQAMNAYSDEARDLILGTCSQESICGQYLHQIKGPAVGIYQMEEVTFDNHMIWLAEAKPGLLDNIKHFCFLSGLPINTDLTFATMIGNLYFATAMCRVHYLRVPEAIPKDDGSITSRSEYLFKLGTYYKKYYNTMLGAATMAEIANSFDKVL